MKVNRMDVRYQVFVSSTYKDLEEERKEVTQAILERNCFPAGMELFPASNRKQWEVIKKVIDESDFYLVVIAGRYGSMGTDDNGNKVSYTEMEFDYAIKRKKPIAALIYDDINKLPGDKLEQNQTNRRKLDKFREKACTGQMIRKWTNKDNLKSATLNAITELVKNAIDDGNDMGWVKVNASNNVVLFPRKEIERKKSIDERLQMSTGNYKHIKHIRMMAIAANLLLKPETASAAYIRQLDQEPITLKEALEKIMRDNNSLNSNGVNTTKFDLILTEPTEYNLEDVNTKLPDSTVVAKWEIFGALHGLYTMITTDTTLGKLSKEGANSRFNYYVTNISIPFSIFNVEFYDGHTDLNHVKIDLYSAELEQDNERRSMIIWQTKDKQNYDFFVNTFDRIKKGKTCRRPTLEDLKGWAMQWEKICVDRN